MPDRAAKMLIRRSVSLYNRNGRCCHVRPDPEDDLMAFPLLVSGYETQEQPITPEYTAPSEIIGV